ncbi:MAG: GntR family transcriptional regulator, partial [Bacteroidota bacterium]
TIFKNMIAQFDLSKPVYDQVKKMIESGKLKPGQKLKQEELADQLGVSRTPLMKALQLLEHELLVESKPRRGMYVKSISYDEMVDVYDCREAIECLAVRLLIERASDSSTSKLIEIFKPFVTGEINSNRYSKADELFHDKVIALANNPVLVKMSTLSNIHKRVYQVGLLRKPEETLPEHLKIIDAIKKRDTELAVEAMRSHIVLSKQELINKSESQYE